MRSGGVQRGAEKAAELIDHAVLEMAATIDILGRIGITVDPFPNEPEDQRATRVLAYTSRSPLPLAATPDRKRSTRAQDHALRELEKRSRGCPRLANDAARNPH